MQRDYFGNPLKPYDEIIMWHYDEPIQAKILKITRKMLHIEKYNKRKTKSYVYPKHVISLEEYKKCQPELFL